MSFQLIFRDYDLELTLALDAAAEDQLLELMSAAISDGPERADLSRQVADAICTLLNCENVPPTEKQIKYAVAIARKLSLTIPPDVLQRREAMTRFLGSHAENYRQRRGRS